VIKNYITYFFFIALIGLVGCKKKQASFAYFTGQIANPKEKEIHLYKKNKEIKKASLNNEHNFSLKIDSIQEGLYSFKHGNEIQYLYFMPKDSLVMRLNTWDFDESLIFSGKGANRNNFLMHLFLENEKQEKLFYKYYRLTENAFLKKADSLLQLKLLAYKQFKETSIEKSKQFDNLVHLAIFYPIYSQMEKYAKINREKHQSVSASFYSFRKKTTLNRKDFTTFYAYRNYVNNYFQNKANQVANKKGIHAVSMVLLEQINSELNASNFKDELLENATINCLLDETCSLDDKQKAIHSFYANCKNSKKIKEVKTITNSMQNIRKGDVLPPLELLNYNGKKVVLNKNNIRQNSVIYFWPKERNRILFMIKRVKYLKKKYPKIRFIGIDSQLDTFNWKTYIKTNNLSKENQFKLALKDANKWFCNILPRAIIVDKNGIIQNHFSYIAQRNFETLLRNLSKN